MKKQLRVLFFVAMLVMLVVVTMLMTSAALVAPEGIDPETGIHTDGTQYPFQILDGDGNVVGYQATLSFADVTSGYTVKQMCDTGSVTKNDRGLDSKVLFFDGNGYTVTYNLQWIQARTGADLTIRNLRLEVTKPGVEWIICTNYTESGLSGGKITFAGENTIIFNANGLDYTTDGTSRSTAAGSISGTKNSRAWLKAQEGTIVFEGTAEKHTTVHQIGHGGGIFVNNGTINATYLTITNMLEDGETLGSAHGALMTFSSSNTGESTFKNCTFESFTGSGQSIRFYGTGTYNFIDCEANGYRTFSLDGNSTVNVYGGTYTAQTYKTVATGEELVDQSGSSVFVFATASITTDLNIYNTTFEDYDGDNYVIHYRVAGTSTVEVYGGTFNHSDGRVVADSTKSATLEFMPVGSTYTDEDGNAATLAAATVFNVGAATQLFNLSGSPAVTVTVGKGVVINLNVAGAALEKLGTDDVVTYGEVTINFAEGAVLPDVDTKFVNCTFVVTGCPAEATLTEGTYHIYSVKNLFDAATESVRGDWIEGVNVKAFNFSGVEVGVIPLVIDGATVNVYDDVYRDLGTLFTLNSGALNISGGEFYAAASSAFTPIIRVNGGNLTITGANTRFVAAEWTGNAGTSGMIYVAGGTVLVNCDDSAHTLERTNVNSIADANFVINKNGIFFFINSDNATVTVERGVFFRQSDLMQNETQAYTTAAVFYFRGGSFKTDMSTTLNINGGYYYANSLVRVYTGANSAGKENAKLSSDADLKVGVTVTVNGGTFVSNAVAKSVAAAAIPFQIASTGKHTITFPATSTFKGYANEYNTYAFFAVNTATGVVGTTLDVQGGTFEIVNGFVSTDAEQAAITITLKNITVTQTGSGTATFIAVHSNINSDIDMEKASKLTIDKVTFITAAQSLFLVGGEAQLVITSGSFVTPRLLNNLENVAENAVITLNGGVFVITGEYTAEGDSVFADYKSENVTVKPAVTIAAPKGTMIHSEITLGTYAPDIYYGEIALKAWITFVANDVAGVILPVLTPGASLYLGENQDSTDEAECGIKFKGTLTFESEEQAEAFWSIDGLEGIGIILAPADYVVAAGAFTINALDTLAQKAGLENTPYYVSNILETEAGYLGDEMSEITFAVALYNLKSTTRAYAAITYVCIEGEYYYGSYDSTANARSAEQIAFNMYENNMPAWENCTVAQKYYSPAPVVDENTGSEEQ